MSEPILSCGARDDVRWEERGNASVATLGFWSRHYQADVAASVEKGKQVATRSEGVDSEKDEVREAGERVHLDRRGLQPAQTVASVFE